MSPSPPPSLLLSVAAVLPIDVTVIVVDGMFLALFAPHDFTTHCRRSSPSSLNSLLNKSPSLVLLLHNDVCIIRAIVISFLFDIPPCLIVVSASPTLTSSGRSRQADVDG